MSAVTVRATLAARPVALPNLTNPRDARVQLQLHVPACPGAVLATVRYSGLGAHGFALRDAKRMRAGDAVTVYCAGFGHDTTGRATLFGVDHLLHHLSEKAAA
jgi:hypothetical protein